MKWNVLPRCTLSSFCPCLNGESASDRTLFVSPSPPADTSTHPRHPLGQRMISVCPLFRPSAADQQHGEAIWPASRRSGGQLRNGQNPCGGSGCRRPRFWNVCESSERVQKGDSFVVCEIARRDDEVQGVNWNIIIFRLLPQLQIEI
jgi:hypothetical protein